MSELSELTLDKLTPEMLEDIFYTEYRVQHAKHGGTNQLIQRDLQMAAWKAVLDAMISASDLEWAKRYLAMRECDAAGGGM